MAPKISAKIAVIFTPNPPENPRKRRAGRPGSPPAGAKAGGEWLYGLHAVQAALANPHRKLGRAVLTPRAPRPSGAKLLDRVRVETMEPGAIDRLLPPGAVHQGAALEAWPLKSRDLDEILAEPATAAAGSCWCWTSFPIPTMSAPSCAPPPLSASPPWWCRTAMPRPSPGALAKAASGALDIIPYVEVVNIARALDQLAERGFWRIALAGDGESSLARSRAGRRCGAGAGIGRRRHPPPGAGTLRGRRLHSDLQDDGKPERLQCRRDRAVRIAARGNFRLRTVIFPAYIGRISCARFFSGPSAFRCRSF